MSTALPLRLPTSGTTASTASTFNRQASLSSFPSSRTPSSTSIRNALIPSSIPRSAPRESFSSEENSSPQSIHPDSSQQPPNLRSSRTLRSQYPADSAERHVEYILVASFHVDRGPIMEQQYPGAISGDENMLAELMLPDQAHVRNQDWTIFFLHKDANEKSEIDEDKEKQLKISKGRRKEVSRTSEDSDSTATSEEDEDVTGSEQEKEQDDEEGGEGPPLIYVLNLVNTKQDMTVKRGAVVKAMAICTRHSFLHIYKPLLLLALEEYFKSPFPETLASLYDAVNTMDLSLMPRLSVLERHILQSSNTKDLFIEKFEHLIQERLAQDSASAIDTSPVSPSKSDRYTLPRDTHQFESLVVYNQVPIPIKVPTAVSPETVGDFSLIKLIQAFSVPHATNPQPLMLHPHLTTNGAYTHPIIVLVNAMLTQKRIIFLGHNRPSGEVAEAVLAACALASGSILRGFTRHAFPYTDLSKIDDLLNVPGFVAGVTNPTFANHPEWWDLLCDLPTGRMKISNRIEAAPITEGLTYFQQQNPHHPSFSTQSPHNTTTPQTNTDPTSDQAFVDDMLRSISARHGEPVIRAKWRAYIIKFTRLAAAFEESVYGASALYIGASVADIGAHGISGHGYVWPDDASRTRELGGNVWRIEGWRNTRSYYSFIQDLAALWARKPIRTIDLMHHHDRLRTLKLGKEDSAKIYLALREVVRGYDDVCQLLTTTPEGNGGLFYVSLGLFHPEVGVRRATVELLERVRGHEAGRHFWGQLGRFAKSAFERIRKEGVEERRKG